MINEDILLVQTFLLNNSEVVFQFILLGDKLPTKFKSWSFLAIFPLSPLKFYILYKLLTILFSLFYYYFHSKCSDELHLLVLLIQTFTSKTGHTTYTRTNHPHFLCIPVVKRKLHLDRFFPRITTLWNWLPGGCFLIDIILISLSLRSTIIFPTYPYNLHIYFHLLCRYNNLISIKQPHSLIYYIELFSGLVLSEQFKLCSIG